MKRASSRKTVERRKSKRGRRPTASAGGDRSPVSRRARGGSSIAKSKREVCNGCGRSLQTEERALFVEEEIGRVFCSEECITGYFTPEIERLEKEYYRRLSSSDLSATEREKLAHLRWITLQEPDEVWREKTIAGDHRYTLISEFRPGNRPVWSICICLYLRGEPSFLYLAFTTRNSAMVNHYRRGERLNKQLLLDQGRKASENAEAVGAEANVNEVGYRSDRLASEWTEDETYLAQMNQERAEDDIPVGEYNLYHDCLEETLENPDEVWSFELGGKHPLRLFHFIRHYPEEEAGVWYLIIAKGSERSLEVTSDLEEEQSQIEIIDAFPTRDEMLVNRYRTGEQEVGGGRIETSSATRVVH